MLKRLKTGSMFLLQGNISKVMTYKFINYMVEGYGDDHGGRYYAKAIQKHRCNPKYRYMACAGSAGGSQPPHQHPYRLPGQCDDNDLQERGEWIPPPPPPKKKQGERGSAKGKQVQAMKQKLGGPIPIIWDPRFPQVRKAVGENSEKFDSELGKIVRNNVPVYTEKWRKVSQQQRELIWKAAQSSFGPLEETHRPAVMRQNSVLLRKWKQRCRQFANKHVKDKKPGPPPKFRDVDSQDDWDQFLQHIATPKFIEMSERNKNNRSKLSYVGTQGRRSMPVHRWKMLTRNNLNEIDQLGVHPIEDWAEKHRRNGVFLNAVAEAVYLLGGLHQMDGLLTFELEARIFEEALGSRRDYLKGLGPTSSSQSATSSQSLQSPSSSTRDAAKIARLERKVNKLQRFMSTIKDHIPSFPDVSEDSSEDNEDEDEDMNVDLDFVYTHIHIVPTGTRTRNFGV